MIYRVSSIRASILFATCDNTPEYRVPSVIFCFLLVLSGIDVSLTFVLCSQDRRGCNPISGWSASRLPLFGHPERLSSQEHLTPHLATSRPWAVLQCIVIEGLVLRIREGSYSFVYPSLLALMSSQQLLNGRRPSKSPLTDTTPPLPPPPPTPTHMALRPPETGLSKRSPKTRVSLVPERLFDRLLRGYKQRYLPPPRWQFAHAIWNIPASPSKHPPSKGVNPVLAPAGLCVPSSTCWFAVAFRRMLKSK